MSVNVNNGTSLGSVAVLPLKGEKGDTGYPTDAQVAQALDDMGSELVDPWMNTNGADVIEEWLDEHPEAVTSIPDGSISAVKFTNEVNNNFADLKTDVTAINLFKPTFWGKTLSGVTYTFNDADNTYDVSGTATANISPILGLVVLEAGTYKLIGMQNAGSSSTYRLNLYNHGEGTLIAQDLGNGAVFTLSQTTTCRVVLYINNGASINITIKPMITKDTNASISDYVPYLYDSDTLLTNIADLKEDLHNTKLNGNKSRNDNIGWLYDVAQSWINNSDNLYYGYENNLFWDTVIPVDNKYPISCSIFAMVMALGIKFENSKYNGLTNNVQNLYGYTDDTLMQLLKTNFSSEVMLPYFIEKGYAFLPASNLSNAQTGDIIFYDMDESNNNYEDYMGIDHSAVYAYRVSDSTYAVWEVGNDDGAVLKNVRHGARKEVCIVRLPFKEDPESKRRVTLSVQEFSAPVPLASLFDFRHNGTYNMWKVSVFGKSYAKGATMSSIYLLRTNATGDIGDCVALYEGTGANARKINNSYNIYDVSGNYDQIVTVVAEWLG